MGPVQRLRVIGCLLPMCDPLPDHAQLQNRQTFVVRLMEVAVRMTEDARPTHEKRFNLLMTDIAIEFRDFIEDNGASPWVLDSQWEDVYNAYFGHVTSSVLCFLVFTCRLCTYLHTRGPVIYPLGILSIKH